MMVYYDKFGYKNWASKVKNILFEHGFGFIWEAHLVQNEVRFLGLFEQRLKDQFFSKFANKCDR